MNFYDTSSLLLKQDIDEPIVISSITLEELENIKNSRFKDEETKAAARKVVKNLFLHKDLVSIAFYSSSLLYAYDLQDKELNNDIKILASALHYKKSKENNLIFYTNDLALYMIASLYFKPEELKQYIVKEDTYGGYMLYTPTEEELIDIYNNPSQNPYNLLINQYLLLQNSVGEIIDKLYWNGEKMTHVSYGNFCSEALGNVKPYRGDIYQTLAVDSLKRNKITLLKGPAGVGKSYLAMGYLFHLLEKHKIDKIIIFCNTVATKGSAKLGYYPGDKNMKLLDSQIGNFLTSKLGDITAVERLIADGSLVLLPMSDIRGYDTTGMNAGIYITEAQNLDINLMKLALQRIGEDSICIIDGDPKTQVDDEAFAGTRNGMKRASKIFRGEPYYGEVELKNIYRSQIAERAEMM